MTHEARIRRIFWIMLLCLCAGLYGALHLKVHAVKSDLVHAERQIVQLEEQRLLLETEYLTRSSQLQLAQWNRVDFGYRPPEAGQFISGERQLAMLGTAPGRARPALPGTQPEIRLASYEPGDAGAAGPQQGASSEPGDLAQLAAHEPEEAAAAPPARLEPAPRLAMVMPRGPTRIQLTALAEVAIR